MKPIKVAYVYMNNLEENNANVNQSLNMVYSLSKLSKITFLSSWINKNRFK